MSEIPWGKCTTCKKDILHGQKYWICNVSTCNTKRNNYVFCTVGCWDAHVPIMRHKDSWAEEKMAPRKLMGPSSSVASVKSPEEILVVASKVKAYIKERADYNTSDRVMEILTEKIKILCNDAIDKAREEGRKTVLDRDF